MNNYYRNFFIFVVSSLTLCVIALLIFIRVERINRYRAAIPEQLKIESVVLQGENNTPFLMLWLLPIRPFSCGGGVFRLSQSTLDEIALEGLAFFKNATQPRGKEYTYSAWQETPVPYNWTNNGAWSGLNCINKNTKLIIKLTKTSALSGSYYTHWGSYKLVVLPELGLVIFAFWD